MSLLEAASSARENGSFELEGFAFVLSDMLPAGGKRAFSLIKPRRAIDGYREVLSRHREPRMVELGIAYGGSTAFFALAARPTKLLAMDINDEPVASLSDFIERNGLTDSVVPVYGVDQSDRERLTAILDREFGTEPLDLVIDDASHLYDLTVASFETLFPRLRPGGDYVIEDWTCDHSIARVMAETLGDPESSLYQWADKHMAGNVDADAHGQRKIATVAAEGLGGVTRDPMGSATQPLSTLVFQLLLLAAESEGIIDSIRIDDLWVTVQRGSAPLEPETFRLADVIVDHFQYLDVD